MSVKINLRKTIEQKIKNGELSLSDITEACDITEMSLTRFLNYETALTPSAFNRLFNFIFNDSHVDTSPAVEEKTDVTHPSYYTVGNIEPIDFIQDKKLGFNLGNVIKYVCRAGLKAGENKEVALQKAIYYIKREIEECRRENR